MRAVACAWAAVACASPSRTGTPSADACDVGVELGTGVTAFEGVAEGQELAMVFGPQGGYHLPLALRGCGLDDAATTHAAATVVSSGARVVDVTLRHAWFAVDACCGELLDFKGYLSAPDTGSDPTVLDGEAVRVEVRAESGGAVFTDAVGVVVRAP